MQYSERELVTAPLYIRSFPTQKNTGCLLNCLYCITPGSTLQYPFYIQYQNIHINVLTVFSELYCKSDPVLIK